MLSAFHFLMALILLLDLSHIRENETEDWIFLSIYLVSCIFLIAAGIMRKKILPTLAKHRKLLLFESALIFCGAIYFWNKGVSLVAFSHGLLAGAIILFWIYLKRKENGETIMVSETNLILPGLSGERMVEWRELANLVKKYDLLTIDFKNNKLLQVQITDADEIGEEEFNQFCRQQLAKTKQ